MLPSNERDDDPRVKSSTPQLAYPGHSLLFDRVESTVLWENSGVLSGKPEVVVRVCSPEPCGATKCIDNLQPLQMTVFSCSKDKSLKERVPKKHLTSLFQPPCFLIEDVQISGNEMKGSPLLTSCNAVCNSFCKAPPDASMP